MNIIVCVKQIPDPETPAASFKVDEAAKKVIPAQGIAPVVNPYDPQATEAALRLNEADGGGKVTVISLGPDTARDAIKHALAMGADEGVLINDPEFDGIDNFQTAKALAAAIEKLGGADLILMGRAAADWDMGVVPTGVGQHPRHARSSPSPRRSKRTAAAIKVERVLDDGFQTVEVNTAGHRLDFERVRRAALPAAPPDHARRQEDRAGLGRGRPRHRRPAGRRQPRPHRWRRSTCRRSKATSRSSRAIRPKRRLATWRRNSAPRS